MYSFSFYTLVCSLLTFLPVGTTIDGWLVVHHFSLAQALDKQLIVSRPPSTSAFLAFLCACRAN